MLKKNELKIIRTTYETETGHDLRLSDQSISDIVDKCEGWDDMEVEEQIALFAKAEETFAGIAIVDPSISAIVAKMDDRFEAELTECLDATIKAKSSAVDIYAQFKRLYSRATLDALPYPGSDKDDVAGTNYKPDIVEKPAIAGGKIRTVFTHDLVYAMPRGKQFQSVIDDIGKETKVAGSIASLKGKSKKDMKAMLSAATQGRNAIRSMVERAIKLHHKLSAIEGMPLVSFEWIGGTDKVKCPAMPEDYQSKESSLVTLAPKPLWFMPVVKGKVQGSEGRDFSVSQVLAFDPAKALKMTDGGTLADLVASAKGEPETPEQLGKKMTDETMDTEVVVISAKLANTQERAALRKRALQPDNDEVRASYCALFVSLRSYYQANENWYDAYLDKQERVIEKEKSDKQALAS